MSTDLLTVKFTQNTFYELLHQNPFEYANAIYYCTVYIWLLKFLKNPKLLMR